ncbi:MAG: FxsA family protein [Pseudomonadales bacterium]|jgi:UPF0716 protein FxsA
MWFLVFFITPIVEMYLLIKVGGYIGALPTIGLVMLTAVIGVTLLRLQGLATLTRGMGRLQGGELPAREVAEGLLLAVAGALLLTPGFVTDTFGFALLIPPLRSRIADRILTRVQVRASATYTTGTTTYTTGTTGRAAGGPGRGSPGRPPGSVLEGEFERLDEADPDGPGRGGSEPRDPPAS